MRPKTASMAASRIRWASAPVLAAWACSSTPTMPSLAFGPWGGDHISLTVAAAGSHVEFDCAQGDIPEAITVDARHQFSVSGTFVRERGGPIPVPAPPPDSHPAVYAGVVNGETMTMTVQLSDTQTMIGAFMLTRGSPGRLVRCLLPLAALQNKPALFHNSTHSSAVDTQVLVRSPVVHGNRLALYKQPPPSLN